MKITQRDGFAAMITILFLCFFISLATFAGSLTTDAIRGYIPKFWDNETLNNSIMYETNNQLNINGSFLINNTGFGLKINSTCIILGNLSNGDC